MAQGRAVGSFMSHLSCGFAGGIVCRGHQQPLHSLLQGVQCAGAAACEKQGIAGRLQLLTALLGAVLLHV